jgi:hypothetical protein
MCCPDILKTVLKFIFNLSLAQRIFPTLWKEVSVVPIFKKGKTALVNNYRPTSILSTFSKISEIINH